MYKAGDHVLILIGEETGKTLPITSVRMFATDRGYYVRGGEGLYAPDQVRLVRERENGNPCGQLCDQRSHQTLKTCDHCRGVCTCKYR